MDLVKFGICKYVFHIDARILTSIPENKNKKIVENTKVERCD